ncbi:MAG: LacI family DNA-binding transcriptional regulator [Chloroflexota bacterium]
MAATLKDVARLAGVSTATVSYVVNGTVRVSPQTRERVLAAIKSLDYHPNVIARSLQGNRTSTLGFILPFKERQVSDPFFLEFLAGIGDEATRYNFDLLISTIPQGASERSVYERVVKSRRVDGLIVADTRHNDERITYLTRQGFPFVAFGRDGDGLDFPYVDVDGQEGVYLGMQHLISLGHRRIGYVSLPPSLVCASHRLNGYKKALRDNGLDYHPSLVTVGDLSQSGGYRALEGFLGQLQPPTAVFAGSDLMALGVINAAQEHGLVVGRDISVMGFDDTQLAAHSHPPLTTVRQPVYRIGKLVAGMLIQIIQGAEPKERQVILPPELQIRESTGPAPGK